MNDKVRRPWLWTTIFTIIAIAYMFPIALVVINSFKNKVYIASEPFAFPTAASSSPTSSRRRDGRSSSRSARPC